MAAWKERTCTRRCPCGRGPCRWTHGAPTFPPRPGSSGSRCPQGFKPSKYFSIDRVFRNEALDATHLAEFHQVEGVIADYGLSLGDLIGVMQAFFTKLGTVDAWPRSVLVWPRC